jgi:hypothetical protein
MNETSSPLADGALSLAELRALGVKPHEINTAWMDDMINRLFVELKRELAQLENAKPDGANERAQNSRTLNSLQRTLERLNRMKVQRAAHSDTSEKPAETRARLAPRILGVVARVSGGRDHEGTDG